MLDRWQKKIDCPNVYYGQEFKRNDTKFNVMKSTKKIQSEYNYVYNALQNCLVKRTNCIVRENRQTSRRNQIICVSSTPQTFQCIYEHIMYIQITLKKILL